MLLLLASIGGCVTWRCVVTGLAAVVGVDITQAQRRTVGALARDRADKDKRDLCRSRGFCCIADAWR